MSQEQLEALKTAETYEFSRNKNPKCPHCGKDFDIQGNEAWDLYSDDGPHDVECLNCELEFMVVTHCEYTFSTDEQESEE